MSKYISPDYMLAKVQKTNSNFKNIVEKENNNIPKQSFQEIFDSINNNHGIKVSKHAYERIQGRKVDLNSSQLEKISKAMDEANKKGIKDALIVLDGKMMIASVKNKTIITMANNDDLKSNIITNINGAILL